MSNGLFRMGVFWHAHLNLLGFAIMMFTRLWFRVVPAASASRLAKAYFWIHQLAFPVQMAALYVFLKGNVAADLVLGPSSVIMGIGILCFAINVWPHTRD